MNGRVEKWSKLMQGGMPAFKKFNKKWQGCVNRFTYLPIIEFHQNKSTFLKFCFEICFLSLNSWTLTSFIHFFYFICFWSACGNLEDFPSLRSLHKIKFLLDFFVNYSKFEWLRIRHCRGCFTLWRRRHRLVVCFDFNIDSGAFNIG